MNCERAPLSRLETMRDTTCFAVGVGLFATGALLEVSTHALRLGASRVCALAYNATAGLTGRTRYIPAHYEEHDPRFLDSSDDLSPYIVPGRIIRNS